MKRSYKIATVVIVYLIFLYTLCFAGNSIWEDEYWYQNGSRGIIISRWRYPELLFPKMEYDSPMEVELVIKK